MCKWYIKAGIILGSVTDIFYCFCSRSRTFNKGQGDGLEIPANYIFSGKEDDTKKLKHLLKTK